MKRRKKLYHYLVLHEEGGFSPMEKIIYVYLLFFLLFSSAETRSLWMEKLLHYLCSSEVKVVE